MYYLNFNNDEWDCVGTATARHTYTHAYASRGIYPPD
jgi:hypothetical protein